MSSNNSYYWWKAENPASDIFQYLAVLGERQSYQHLANIKYMRLYGNYDYESMLPYTYNKATPSYSIQNRVTLNVIQSMVDTVVSKITTQKPRPLFLTSGGDFSAQRKAKKLTQFADGLFYSTQYYKKAQRAFKDACITGDGFLKVYIDASTRKICLDRVISDELEIDDAESTYGEPRQMHQRKWIHRDVLKAMFPKFKSEIEWAATENTENRELTVKNKDMILVVESWRLPSSAKKKDGMHAICIRDCTLFEEKYKKDYFPFVKFSWRERSLGYWSQGIAEQLAGLQLEINKILRTIQISMHLVSVPKVYVEAGSKIVDAHINNEIGTIIRYAGTMPTPGVLGQIPPDLFNHLQNLYTKAYEIIGVSQLSATSLKPDGLDSGKALRTYNNIESQRFMEVGQMYEAASLETIRQMIDLAKELDAAADETRAKAAEAGAEVDESVKDFEVPVPGGKFLRTIKWKDVSLDDDQYVMQAFPVNLLSNEPAARLSEIQEMMSAGLMSPENGKKLLNFPDLEEYNKFENAGVDDLQAQVERMLDTGNYEAPEPYQNLAYGIKFFQSVYLHYRSEKAPEATLQLFRQWMDDANELLNRSKEEMLAQQNSAATAVDAAAGAQAAPVAVEAPVAQFA